MIKPLIFYLIISISYVQPYCSCFRVVSKSKNPDYFQGDFEYFEYAVDVFGFKIYADSGIDNCKIQHAAAVTQQLLDNDGDGEVDDQLLIEKLREKNAFMGIFESESSDEKFFDNYDGHGTSAVLYKNEMDYSNGVGHWGSDATVEEIMHTINAVGHVAIYPEAFAFEPDSSLLTEAMDIARGGQFLEVPKQYPEGAWYTYDDETCDYGCMAIEYLYWASVSYMGILDDEETCQGIAHEWKPCSREKLQEMDVKMYALITNPDYKMPLVAPQGCQEGLDYFSDGELGDYQRQFGKILQRTEYLVFFMVALWIFC